MGTDRRIVYAIAGTAAVGAGAALVYYIYTKQNQAAMGLMDLNLKVEEKHVTWLEGIASKYTGGDIVKALHNMIDNCQAVSTDSKLAEMIFEKIRCNSCGKKKKVNFSAKLTGDQVAFIENAVEKYDITGGKEKALRVMFEYAINDAEENIMFGV